MIGGEAVEHDFVADAAAEEVELRTQESLERSAGAIDMKLGGAAKEVEGGNQANEAKAMVAVEMGDEYVVEARKLEAGLAESQLGAFGTVDQEELVAHIDHLRRGQVFGRGECATATKNMNIKFFHTNEYWGIVGS